MRRVFGTATESNPESPYQNAVTTDIKGGRRRKEEEAMEKKPGKGNLRIRRQENPIPAEW